MSSPFMEQVNRTPVTFMILLAYITLGMVTGLADVNYDKLQQFGAAEGFLVQQGEPWRLLAYAFLHGGMLHLFLNSYFLFIIGPSLEQALGTKRFVLVYVISAIGGGIGGNLWHNPFTPLVGGSGALFGMMGAGVALNMRQGRHLLDFLNYVGPRMLVMLIGANLVLGLLIPMVSNAGHIGGLVAGFVLTFCFLARGREPIDRASRAVQAGWVALFASLLFYCTHPVVRIDYLLQQYQSAHTAEERTAYARAALRRAEDQPTLARYVATLLDEASLPEKEAFWNELLRSARGG